VKTVGVLGYSTIGEHDEKSKKMDRQRMRQASEVVR
jgi:hypothetical protein